MKYDKVFLRRLKDDINDYKLLDNWYQQEEIYLAFEQRKLSLEEIKNKYYPRTLKNSNIPVYIIEYDNIPIGIIQYKIVDEINKEIYKLSMDNCYEIDIFIGNLNYHNKNIGKTSINLLSDYLFKNKNANAIVMCPLINNQKAINCYKKCDFKINMKFQEKDTIGNNQEYYLMIKNKDNK